jgi:ribonuclease-3
VFEEGPEHRKVFTVEVQVHGNTLAQGTGHSKQEAEREAARNALSELEDSPDSTLEGVS